MDNFMDIYLVETTPNGRIASAFLWARGTCNFELKTKGYL